MARQTAEEREEFLAEIKTEFDARLARVAADPAHWVTFIEQVAAFGARYSLGNQMLLMMQAERRAITPQFFLPYGNKEGTSGWLREKRQVRKGETAFKVWAPVTKRPTDAQAAQWEATGRKVRREPNGRPVKQLVGFHLASTFDLSQTDGEPFEVPTIERIRRARIFGGHGVELLDGDDPTDAYDDIVKLIKDHGYAFDLAAPGSRYLGTANGVTVTSAHMRQVLVRDDVGGAQRVKTSVHELAHIRCGHCDAGRLDEDPHQGRQETEAESVAHIVCRALGLDTQAYSDAYVLGWADGDMKLVAECAETVLKVSKQILADLTPSTDATTDAADPNY